MIGIYHNKDLDGICCGAILKHKYPDIKLIGMDYCDDIPENPNNEEMIICDLSWSIYDMQKISFSCNDKLTWIDHHISAIKEFENNNRPFPISVLLSTGISACELTWEYLFPEKKVPIIVRLLGAYDTWRQNERGLDWQTVILPFQYGLRLICNSLEDFPYSLLQYGHSKELFKIIENGKMILKYQSKQNERACNSAFNYLFEGFRAICLNMGGGNSTMFETIYNPNQHDIMITFVYNGTNWRYTLFTTNKNIDCSEIAKKYGGGGHKSAAGFTTKELIFNPNKK